MQRFSKLSDIQLTEFINRDLLGLSMDEPPGTPSKIGPDKGVEESPARSHSPNAKLREQLRIEQLAKKYWKAKAETASEENLWLRKQLKESILADTENCRLQRELQDAMERELHLKEALCAVQTELRCSSRDADVAAKQSLISSLQQRVAQQRANLAVLNKRIAEHDRKIQAMQNQHERDLQVLVLQLKLAHAELKLRAYSDAVGDTDSISLKKHASQHSQPRAMHGPRQTSQNAAEMSHDTATDVADGRPSHDALPAKVAGGARRVIHFQEQPHTRSAMPQNVASEVRTPVQQSSFEEESFEDWIHAANPRVVHIQQVRTRGALPLENV